MTSSSFKDLDFLKNKMFGILTESKSESTNKKYRGYFSKWEEFCRDRNLKILPADSLDVALFLTKLIHEEKSKSVVLPTVYAIKYFHELKGFEFDIKSPFIKNLMEASKRRPVKNSNKKDPFSASDLIKICKKFNDSGDLADSRDLVVMTLSFSGFLRFDELVNLRTKNVSFFDDHLELCIEKSKTDQYRDGDKVLIAKGETIACPIFRLKEYLKLAKIDVAKDQFLFRAIYSSKEGKKLVGGEKKISYTRVRECIRAKVNQIDGVPKNFGLHSFRSGGATAAAQADVSHLAIKRHGRWRSDSSKERYIKVDLERRLKVTKALGL